MSLLQKPSYSFFHPSEPAHACFKDASAFEKGGFAGSWTTQCARRFRCFLSFKTWVIMWGLALEDDYKRHCLWMLCANSHLKRTKSTIKISFVCLYVNSFRAFEIYGSLCFPILHWNLVGWPPITRNYVSVTHLLRKMCGPRITAIMLYYERDAHSREW